MDNQNQNNQPLDQKTRNEVALLSYVNDLLREYTDPDIKPEDVSKAREILLIEVQDFINHHFLDLLSDEKQIEFGKVLDESPTEEKVNQFLENNILHLEQEVAKALFEFRAIYLAKKNSQPSPPESLKPAPLN